MLRELFLKVGDYRTPKLKVVKDKRIALLYRLIQLGIVLYLIVWVFIYKKKYQNKDTTILSSVVTKLKGVSLTNTSKTGEVLWGPEDYVFPPQGDNVLFVVTSFINTPQQKLARCAESHHVRNAICKEDKDCPKDESLYAGNGIGTGKCLKNPGGNSTCEIFGWCPLEAKTDPVLLPNAENFTIYIKNFIQFPKFEFSTSNIQDVNRTFLRNCLYDDKSAPKCPIFQLGDIAKRAGSNFEKMRRFGASIGILIEWDCDLDKSYSLCGPKYHFKRLDENIESISSGVNFRNVQYLNRRETRHLYKVYGVRLAITVQGKAGRFAIIPTAINVATVVTLIGAAAYVCNFAYYTIRKYEKRRSSASRKSHRNKTDMAEPTEQDNRLMPGDSSAAPTAVSSI